MKKGATFKENIQFLINAYKRELEIAEKENREIYEIELMEAYIDELEFLIEISK